MSAMEQMHEILNTTDQDYVSFVEIRDFHIPGGIFVC